MPARRRTPAAASTSPVVTTSRAVAAAARRRERPRARERRRGEAARACRTHLRKPALVAALLLVALALLTAACSGGGASGNVRFLVFGDPAELRAFRNVVTEFRKVEPDVTVTLVEASDRDDLIARLSTSFAGGQPPGPLPHQLPLLRPVRGPRRARAHRGAAARLGRVRGGRLLREGPRGVQGRR